MKILVGLYESQAGSIDIDGIKIDDTNSIWYRNHFSTIFSDYFLFDHVLNKEGELVKMSDVEDRVLVLKLQGKVDIVDGKLSTIKLSQGQRKRVALLLAYAEDAEVFVFDEWAADQDPYFREYFYTKLIPELQSLNKTIVVMSHDDKYFYTADRICEFEAGIVSSIIERKHENCA
tara:strand:- start:830 stop:1354 length:525 start_codon:yes stop_codon:yes gene_type:complete